MVTSLVFVGTALHDQLPGVFQSLFCAPVHQMDEPQEHTCPLIQVIPVYG